MTTPHSGEPAFHAAVPRPLHPALASLPKVLLHEHLDGSLRVNTLIALAQGRGLTLPHTDPAALAAWFRANAMAGSLERYLQGFGLTVAAMGDLQAIEQVSFEVAEDARAAGCVLAEFRMAPLLLADLGLDAEAVMEAMLRGLARSALPCGLIVCGMRHEPPDKVRRSADLALQFRAGPGRPVGVVGFDLAGPEAGFPATLHARTLEHVAGQGLPITLHAGEADGGTRVVEAISLGARRIGHGVRLADLLDTTDGEAALALVAQRRVHLEVCPTSNVQTGAAASIAAHPIRALWQAGVSLSFHTDNTLISCTDLNLEGQALLDEAGFTLADLLAMQRLALEASFLPTAVRDSARQALDTWARIHDHDLHASSRHAS